MKTIRITVSTVVLLALLLIAVTPVSAADPVTYGFYCITNNIAGDEAIAEAQLTVVVAEGAAGHVLFTFHNAGPAASSITDFYFDDGSLLGISNLINGPGVSVSQGASPNNLPGANNATPPFVTTAGFNADSDSPAQPNGVNPGEYVTIDFALQGTQTHDDVVGQLASGELRIGIHVQGFASGGSESCVNGPPTAITLASFEAKAAGSAVSLEWATGTEISNAGFNLYRAAAENGARTKVNGGLLAASGDATSGATYSYVDNPGYGTFYYWLEDVEFTGATALHGPVTVTLESPIRRPLHRPVLPGTN
jgi:hypothetical protein